MIQIKAFKNGFNTCVVSHTGGLSSACSTKACIGREQNKRYCKLSCNTLLCAESFKSDSHVPVFNFSSLPYSLSKVIDMSRFSVSVLYLSIAEPLFSKSF